MTPEEFVAELDAHNTRALDRIGEKSGAGEPGPDLTVAKLLMLALKNELERPSAPPPGWSPRRR